MLLISHGIDVLVIVLLIIGLICGAYYGLAHECARLFAFTVGITVAFQAGPFINKLFPQDKLTWEIIALALILALALIVGVIIAFVTRRFLRLLIGQPMDGILGAVATLLTTGIIIFVIFFFLYQVPVEKVKTIVFEDSVAGKTAQPLIEEVKGRLFHE